MKKHLTKRLGGPGNEKTRTMVRSAQWLYWHRLKPDLWTETGRLLQWHFAHKQG